MNPRKPFPTVDFWKFWNSIQRLCNFRMRGQNPGLDMVNS
jgi:hypothetical protein